MRNVPRPNIPASLRAHGAEWTRELMAAVAEYRREGTPIPKRLQNRYGKADVLAALKVMYCDGSGRYYCCYCEKQIDRITAPRIEHRRPKSPDKFPEYTFDWDNLHLACETCNRNKSDKWDDNNEILDAATDVPITAHLGYREGDIGEGIYREALSDRGWTTAGHAGLNDVDLRLGRLHVFSQTARMILDIAELVKRGENARACTAKQMLDNKCLGEYGSMIKYLLDRYAHLI